MYKVALLLAFLAVASADQICRLSDLVTVVNFRPELWEGPWFEQYFFARRNYNLNDIYEDFTYEVKAQGLDMQVKELTRRTPAEATCTVANDQLRRWEADGKYYYYKAQTGQANVKSWILDTDYNSYAVEFLCYDVRGDTCYDSEVSLWTRAPNDLAQKQLVLSKFRAIFNRAVCNSRAGGFNQQRVLEIRHTGNLGGIYGPQYFTTATTYPTYPYGSTYPYGYAARCTALPIRYLNVPGTYPYPGVYPGTGVYPGAWNSLLQTYDPALVQAEKDSLIAEKEKLITEREMLILKKEQLQLLINRLRTGAPAAGGIPK